MVARYFEYEKDFQDTPFLSKIKLFTDSRVKEAKFNIRLYSKGANGEPDEFIYNENILGVAKKGRRITEVDLSAYKIELPDDGFFIAVEWLIVASNTNSKSGTYYAPDFGQVPASSNASSWFYTRGKWKKEWHKINNLKCYKNKYSHLAMELTLTN